MSSLLSFLLTSQFYKTKLNDFPVIVLDQLVYPHLSVLELHIIQLPLSDRLTHVEAYHLSLDLHIYQITVVPCHNVLFPSPKFILTT